MSDLSEQSVCGFCKVNPAKFSLTVEELRAPLYEYGIRVYCCPNCMSRVRLTCVGGCLHELATPEKEQEH
jgi:hypothetical protein